METVKGKHILVVGATGGIGTGVVSLLAASGAHLFLAGRNAAKLQQVAAGIQLPPEKYCSLDISDAGAVAALKEQFFAVYPTIDVLVNAAGTGIIKNMDSLTEADFLQSLQANLIGPFLLVKAFLPAMKEVKKGLIINIPGVLGKTPMAGAAAYSASKYGLTGMMQSIREEIKRTDIRITNLFLGGVDSAFWGQYRFKGAKRKNDTGRRGGKSHLVPLPAACQRRSKRNGIAAV